MAAVQIIELEKILSVSNSEKAPGLRVRAAGEALGVSAWGMNVLELDAGCDAYREHDHLDDGQEEVYLVLEGSGKLVTPDAEFALLRGTFIRVPAEVTRKFVPGVDGIRMLAIGATPGKAVWDMMTEFG